TSPSAASTPKPLTTPTHPTPASPPKPSRRLRTTKPNFSSTGSASPPPPSPPLLADYNRRSIKRLRRISRHRDVDAPRRLLSNPNRSYHAFFSPGQFLQPIRLPRRFFFLHRPIRLESLRQRPVRRVVIVHRNHFASAVP